MPPRKNVESSTEATMESTTALTAATGCSSSEQFSPSIGNISKAINNVMGDINGVEKNMTVGTGNYGYKGVSDQDVKKEVRTLMNKYGLSLVPLAINAKSEVSRWQDGGGNAKQSIYTEVQPVYLLMHTSGEWIKLSGYGQGIDTQDKGAGKATTYALKYLLLYLFLIPTGKIDDADNEHSNDMAAPPVQKQWMSDAQVTATVQRIQAAKNGNTAEVPAEIIAKAQEHFNISQVNLKKLQEA